MLDNKGNALTVKKRRPQYILSAVLKEYCNQYTLLESFVALLN